jgi:Asp-tRNA(Asn)/Glu-tRNA(Gln) amidotransferase A subunit family amidase
LARQETFDLWEPHIRSFVALCLEPAETHPGPLAGLTLGVKDIIDVEGLPTRNGSAACDGAPPALRDATVVAALRAAGARIVGKTVTTEFAFTDPTDCRNPHDINRSPGGSSSGSGAAVAAGLVDLALGTQTAGSLCRPAAYCGIVGLKPGCGVLPTAGVTPLAPSFDAPGIMARSVDLAARAFQAMTGMQAGAGPSEPTLLQGVFDEPVTADPEALAALEAAGSALSATGIPVNMATLEVEVERIIVAHRCVMLAEAAEVHGYLLDDKADLLRPNFRECLEVGGGLSVAEVAEARGVLAEARTRFWKQMEGVDAILTLPVPEGAPRIDGTTGFQGWLTPWTVFGGPLVSLPWGLDSLGRPRAVMLAGAPGSEMDLLALAARLEALAPTMPRPAPPAA